MNRAPHIASALKSAGLHEAARHVHTARTAAEEITALRIALATLDGAQHVLRCYARSLRNTRALEERAALRVLEERVLEHLGGLLRRAHASGELARVVQEG